MIKKLTICLIAFIAFQLSGCSYSPPPPEMVLFFIKFFNTILGVLYFIIAISMISISIPKFRGAGVLGIVVSIAVIIAIYLSIFLLNILDPNYTMTVGIPFFK